MAEQLTLTRCGGYRAAASLEASHPRTGRPWIEDGQSSAGSSRCYGRGHPGGYSSAPGWLRRRPSRLSRASMDSERAGSA
jgi:hypothetical protein